MQFGFQILARDPTSRARSGNLKTLRGEIPTPVFMPVGTAATVKALTRSQLEQLGADIILANTYHLYLRPGVEVVEQLGGVHRFMNWTRPMLTDSGGYQVFSHRELRKLSDEGVEFRSHLDGSVHFLSPEGSIRIQQQLGADIVMAFDECTPFPVSQDEARLSMELSMRWSERCRAVHTDGEQVLFGIVQGGVFPELRQCSLEWIERIGFAGIALGGFSVGEPSQMMYEQLARLGEHLPETKPHYLMGVGTPLDLLQCVALGIDMFDCVMPTRNARNGTLFTSRGRVRIKNARYRSDESALDPDCRCWVCQEHSRAYLRHLFVAGEILASVLNSYHNLHFYLDLMRRIRESIAQGRFPEFRADFERLYCSTLGTDQG